MGLVDIQESVRARDVGYEEPGGSVTMKRIKNGGDTKTTSSEHNPLLRDFVRAKRLTAACRRP
jgi:hypothetical protein